MVVDVLDLLGDNASPGTAANTVALVLHKLGSGGSSTAARIRFSAQMTTTGDTALLDAAPEPSDGGDGLTRIVRTATARHYLMLGATADGTTVQLAFDVTEAYTVRQTQQRALPHDVRDPHRHRRGRVVGHVLSADAPARHTFPRIAGAGARQPQLPGARALARRGGAAGIRLQPYGRAARAERQPHSGEHGAAGAVHGRLLARDENTDDLHHRLCPTLLRSQVLTPDEQMDAANYIFSEGKRLEALGLKLLDMLSLDQSKLQLVPASPADLVAGLLEHLKRVYAQKGIALQYRTAEGMCFLEPDLFKTLLVNLMDNARKALDNGGYIYVWQEMLPDGCRVRVLDNGRGIPPEALTHLTEAFYRVDKSRLARTGRRGPWSVAVQ